MSDLKKIIAENITRLRKSENLTQAELAESLNYSDKAISKWERAEALPDISIIKQIADMFGVTADYLLIHHENEDIRTKDSLKANINKLYLSLLSASPIWILATIAFAITSIFARKSVWYVFYISVPLTALIFLIFNSLFGNKRKNYLIVSIFIWTLFIALYFTFFKFNLWQIFILGVPAQLVIIFWSKLRKNK